MEFDYFYGQQSEQFSFYRIPKMLFTDDRFWNVSTDAKLLYGILLDRMNLSARNGWMDAAGRVYIIFTLEETMAALNCGDNKATKLYKQMPVLLLSGQDDPVGDFGKGVQRVRQSMSRAGMKHIQLYLVPGARHDLLHEEKSGGSDEAFDILTNWLFENI